MIKFLKKYRVSIIFIVFFILVLIQHQFVYLYHDDYGYASLSYTVNIENVVGHDFSFGQIIQFLIGHYFEWGGRVLDFLYEIVLLGNGLGAFRLVQSLVITGIFALVYLIGKKHLVPKFNDWKIALLSVSLYGVFDIMLIRSGIFWASASTSYVFPILFLLLFIYLYENHNDKNFKNNLTKILFYVFNTILIFAAAFSQEQIGVVAVGYIILYTVFRIWKNRKIDKIDILMSVVSIIGFAILFFAPGNEVRKLHPSSLPFYSLPLIDRLKISIPDILLNNFSTATRVFSILFFASITYIGIKNLKLKKGIHWINIISLLSTSIILFISTIQSVGYFNWAYNIFNNNIFQMLMMLGFFIQLGLIAYSISIYLLYKKEYSLLNLFFCGIVSQAAMMMAPYFPLRSTIIFEVICFILMIRITIDIFNELKIKSMIYYLIVPIVFWSLFNFCNITWGYYNNNAVNKQNDRLLTETSQKIQNGENVNSVTLKKLPDILYSGEQPYTEGNNYILIWMREYYNLPKDFEINYID